MFNRKKGVVSLWIGQGLKKRDFHRYAVEEGDLEIGPTNGFANDAKDISFDHDFVTSFCTGRKDEKLAVLLNGLDWAAYELDGILATAKRKRILSGNSLVAMLDVELKPSKWPKSSPLSFIGTFAYEPAKPDVIVPKKAKSSHRDAVLDAHFSPDGKFAITSDYNDFRLWNTSNGNLVAKKKTDNAIFAYWLSDETFLSGGLFKNPGFTLWKISSEKLVRSKAFPTEQSISRHCLAQDGESVFWIKSKPVVGQFSNWCPQDVPDAKVVNQSQLALPDGRVIAVDLKGDCRVWELATQKLCHKFSLKLNARDFHGLLSDSEVVAQVAGNGQQVVINSETGKMRKLKRPQRLDQGIVFQKQGAGFLVGSGGSTVQGKIRMWSLENGDVLNDIKINETNVVTAFAPKKSLAVTVSFQGIVTIWNFVTGEPLANWTNAPAGRTVENELVDGDGHELTSVDITRDGKKVIVGHASGRVTMLGFQRRRLKQVAK